MSLLSTLWHDLEKIFAFAPVVAVVDPNAAGGIDKATAAIKALQPTVAAIAAANTSQLSHADMVAQVTNAVASSSAKLAELGLVDGATNDHVQAAAPLINAAVAVSGLAAPSTGG